jgi:putative oxidoreductase
VGGVFVVHGVFKVMGGPERWVNLGNSLDVIGLPFPGPPLLWGLLATLMELVGGMLLILGLAFRPALVGLIGTMTVATLFLLSADEPKWTQWSHPLTVGLVFISMMLLGPGPYSMEGEPKDSVAMPLPEKDSPDS